MSILKVIDNINTTCLLRIMLDIRKILHFQFPDVDILVPDCYEVCLCYIVWMVVFEYQNCKSSYVSSDLWLFDSFLQILSLDELLIVSMIR